MANQSYVIHKHSNVYTNGIPKAPTTGMLKKGELAVNYNSTEPAIFLEKDNGVVVQFSPRDVMSAEIQNATSSKANISDLTTHTGNTTIHVTSTDKATWNNKYSLPSTGIPKTDLATNVQTSLGKADSAIQSVKTINNTAITGTGNTTLVASIKIDGVTKTPNTGTTNAGLVDLGYVVQNIYMNGSNHNPTTGSTNTGRVNLGNIVTSIKVNGSNKTITSGAVDLGDIYSKSEVNTIAENEVSARESAISAEAAARENADNTKENKLTTASGYSASGNRVLVSLDGNIQWTPFNNILAGSTTPMSSEGNNGDLYIQTQ